MKAPHPAARDRYRAYATYLPLLVMLVLWLWLMALALFVYVPKQYGPLAILGPDFGMFYSAGRVLATGGNPYVPSHLAAVDASIMRHAHLPTFPFAPLVRVGNPPLFFWIMKPLAALPYRTALYIWIALLIVALGIGLLASLRYSGWTRRAACVLFFLAPTVQIGLRSSNLVPFVFAGVGLALALARNRPTFAGAILTLAWLKPQLGLPIAGIIMLFQTPFPRRVLFGFVAATALETLLTLLVTGPMPLLWWLRSFTGYSSSIAIQGDLASLAGIYYRWAPARVQLVLEAATVGVASALTAYWWWRNRRRQILPISVGWLWFVWFLATPYAHFDDQILLTVPVLAVLGHNGGRLSSVLSALTLYSLFLCVLPYNASIPQMQLIWLPTLVAAICASIAAARTGTGEAACGSQATPIDRREVGITVPA